VSEGKTDERVEHNHSARNLPSLRAIVEGRSSVPVRGKRRGFLPFETNPFDRVFVGLVLLVAIHLVWLRFVERFIPLIVATILSLVLCVIILLRG
jgi:predicted small integral membrane protein